ncbi:3'-5' exonuclease [Arcobacter sp. FWKO B]|uniref:3'-5' exonuclease n=1 Tax=Arcobacter sp. FWKO B TaxID=2593672 RepID=UPI0018A5F032|nr:3'-5' exonuclease [Arcobacter sp. FWKO B]QOG11362.1 3'-5' exonuclease [Arcobacter sp. FWKO B]
MSSYILFDTETTGGNEEDRIIQVGGIVLSNGSKPLVFDELCSSEVPIKIEAMEVHNITQDMLMGKPSFLQTKFYNMLQKHNQKENYLIAHNINFDLGMLIKEGFVCNMQIIDTLRCARHLLDELPYHRLQYLRYALDLYKIEKDEAMKLNIEIKAHDAIGDVLVMKLLLTKLTQIAKDRYNLSNKDSIAKLVELSDTPVFVKILKFGKYKGQNLETIASSDKGYLEWLLNTNDLDSDLKYSIKKVL